MAELDYNYFFSYSRSHEMRLCFLKLRGHDQKINLSLLFVRISHLERVKSCKTEMHLSVTL